MKKCIKTIKILTLLLIVVLIIVLAFFGFFRKNSNIWNNLIPDYNYGMELKGVRELKYITDTSEEEKNVYVDSNGNILGVVIENEDNSTEESNEGVSLEVDEGLADNQNAENLVSETESEKVPYATENRVIKANEDDVLTIENFEMSKKIIQKRLESRNIYEYNIRLDTVTGELIVELPETQDTDLLAELIYATRKNRNNRQSDRNCITK